MRNFNKSDLKKSGIFLLLLLMAVYTYTVHRYGNFNIFGSPHRIFIHGFRYDNDNYHMTLTGDNKPTHEVSNLIDRLTGKRIYSTVKNFKATNGTRVYMQVEGDEYIQLMCGGGG